MNKLFRLTLLLSALVVASFCSAQGPAEKAAASDKVVDHIRELDLLNHILPILWTKEQLNAILPALEKVRQTVNVAHDNEYHKLLSLDPKLTAAIDKALNEAQVPGRDLLKTVNDQLTILQTTRAVLGKKNEGEVYEVIVAKLNPGQKKAMANDLDPASINPSLSVEKMSDEDKIHFYIRNVLLDPLAYDLLVKLSRSSAIQDK